MREKEIIRCDKGTLEKRKGINIVHLKGSYAEMGWQHGKLAAEVCGDIGPNYLNEIMGTLVGHRFPALGSIANRSLKWLFYAFNKKRIGRPMMDQVAGLTEAWGLSLPMAAKAIMVPDILHFLIGKTFPSFLPTAPGCSGFMARGTATEGGKLIVGRNFDFFGQGIWDENNALIFMEPEDGQKFCWMGTLGVPGSGQAMNESGLILALFTMFNRDVRLTGVPVFTLVGKMLEKCESVDDAMNMIGEQPRLCGLSLMAVDSKTQEAAVAGFSANRMEVIRPENDVLVRTNHYVTEKMKIFEVAPYPWVLSSTGRFTRLHQLLEKNRGSLKPADVPGIMSDNIDIYDKRKRLAGYTLRTCNNSQCIVFSPDEDAMFIGNDPFPVCTSRKFMGFRISALFSGDRDGYEIGDIDGASDMSETERKAQKHYQAAWAAHLDYHQDDLAIMHLRRAEECEPGEPAFPRLAGFLLMKKGRFVQALPFMEKNAVYQYNHDIMKAEAHLWYGRCLDLAGMRKEALQEYRNASATGIYPVADAAKKNIEVPFKKKSLATVSPEFVVGTVLARY